MNILLLLGVVAVGFLQTASTAPVTKAEPTNDAEGLATYAEV